MFFYNIKINIYKEDNYIYLHIPKGYTDGIIDKQYQFDINDFICTKRHDYFVCGTDSFKRAYLLSDIIMDDYIKQVYLSNEIL